MVLQRGIWEGEELSLDGFFFFFFLVGDALQVHLWASIGLNTVGDDIELLYGFPYLLHLAEQRMLWWKTK